MGNTPVTAYDLEAESKQREPVGTIDAFSDSVLENWSAVLSTNITSEYFPTTPRGSISHEESFSDSKLRSPTKSTSSFSDDSYNFTDESSGGSGEYLATQAFSNHHHDETSTTFIKSQITSEITVTSPISKSENNKPTIPTLKLNGIQQVSEIEVKKGKKRSRAIKQHIIENTEEARRKGKKHDFKRSKAYRSLPYKRDVHFTVSKPDSPLGLSVLLDSPQTTVLTDKQDIKNGLIGESGTLSAALKTLSNVNIIDSPKIGGDHSDDVSKKNNDHHESTIKKLVHEAKEALLRPQLNMSAKLNSLVVKTARLDRCLQLYKIMFNQNPITPIDDTQTKTTSTPRQRNSITTTTSIVTTAGTTTTTTTTATTTTTTTIDATGSTTATTTTTTATTSTTTNTTSSANATATAIAIAIANAAPTAVPTTTTATGNTPQLSKVPRSPRFNLPNQSNSDTNKSPSSNANSTSDSTKNVDTTLPTSSLLSNTTAGLKSKFLPPLQTKELYHKKKKYARCVSGSDIVDWMIKNGLLVERVDAVQVGQQFLVFKLIQPLVIDVNIQHSAFQDDPGCFYYLPEDLQEEDALSHERLVNLLHLTYFERDEIKSLWGIYKKTSVKTAGGTYLMTVESIKSTTPAIQEHVPLILALFNAFHSPYKSPNCFTFEEFVTTLSIFSRGTTNERAQFVTRMCSESGAKNTPISLDRVLKLAQHNYELLKKLQWNTNSQSIIVSDTVKQAFLEPQQQLQQLQKPKPKLIKKNKTRRLKTKVKDSVIETHDDTKDLLKSFVKEKISKMEEKKKEKKKNKTNRDSEPNIAGSSSSNKSTDTETNTKTQPFDENVVDDYSNSDSIEDEQEQSTKSSISISEEKIHDLLQKAKHVKNKLTKSSVDRVEKKKVFQADPDDNIHNEASSNSATKATDKDTIIKESSNYKNTNKSIDTATKSTSTTDSSDDKSEDNSMDEEHALQLQQKVLGSQVSYISYLSHEKFTERVTQSTEFCDFFGLFSYLSHRYLKNLHGILVVHNADIQKEGKVKMKAGALLSRAVYLKVQGHFLAIYSSEEHAKKNSPEIVVPLGPMKILKNNFNPRHFEVVSFRYLGYFVARDIEDRNQWVRALEDHTNPLIPNRFDSFAPLRPGINTRWFVRGKEYFKTLISCIEKAVFRICITDWFFSDGLYLTREPHQKEKRLDLVLKAAAERGVKIYVLLWDNIEAVFSLGARYTCVRLNKLHQNVCAMYHRGKLDQIPWSHHQKTVIVDDKVAFVGGIDLCYGRYEDERYMIVDNPEKVYPGADYTNQNIVGEQNLKSKGIQVDRAKIPRMPWHDIHCQVDGLAAMDVQRNFVERWNFVRLRFYNTFDKAEFLMPLSTQQFKDGITLPSEISDQCYKNCNVQVVRSFTTWGGGSHLEHSIYKGYSDIIKRAQHYIYIENQYFVSHFDRSKVRPLNKILLYLKERLKSAMEANQKFRLIIVLPVHPAGNVEETSTQVIIKYTAKTINVLKKSLQDLFPQKNVDDYVTLHALRQHDYLGGKPITEQVYVHSKMMIVDDKIAVIGSANINDRSLLGARDSEICCVIEQPESSQVSGLINGKQHKISPFARDLRMHIWKRYLGVPLDRMVADPISDSTYKLWKETSANNSKIYKQLFPRILDNITTSKDLRGWVHWDVTENWDDQKKI